MRVLVCPTAFKGSIGAAEAADVMARGVRRALPDARVRRLPLSDGGPGLVDALRAAGRGVSIEEVEVSGPLGAPARGRILWMGEVPARAGEPRGSHGGRRAGGGSGADGARTAPAEAEETEEAEADGSGHGAGAADVAVLESADACGLHLVPEGGEDALRADTRGVGELIGASVERGARRVVVGLGGSATTDGGTGMARAFGYRFRDGSGGELPPGGGALSRLAGIVPGLGPSVPVTALADVETPLNGARGAARTFGPQKGATEEELEELVAGLERLAGRLEADLGRGEAADLPGSGAAGGLGAGLAAFLGAAIVPGAAWVLEAVAFGPALAEADLVVTGEGAFDATSREGKIVGRVLERARGAGVPALLLCGRIDASAVPDPGYRDGDEAGDEAGGPSGDAAGGSAGDAAGGPPAGAAAGADRAPPVRAADGGGERLDPAGLEELAAREAAALSG